MNTILIKEVLQFGTFQEDYCKTVKKNICEGSAAYPMKIQGTRVLGDEGEKKLVEVEAEKGQKAYG